MSYIYTSWPHFGEAEGGGVGQNAPPGAAPAAYRPTLGIPVPLWEGWGQWCWAKCAAGRGACAASGGAFAAYMPTLGIHVPLWGAGVSGVRQNAPPDAAHAPHPAALLQPTCLLGASMFHFWWLGAVVLGKMHRRTRRMRRVRRRICSLQAYFGRPGPISHHGILHSHHGSSRPGQKAACGLPPWCSEGMLGSHHGSPKPGQKAACWLPLWRLEFREERGPACSQAAGRACGGEGRAGEGTAATSGGGPGEGPGEGGSSPGLVNIICKVRLKGHGQMHPEVARLISDCTVQSQIAPYTHSIE